MIAETAAFGIGTGTGVAAKLFGKLVDGHLQNSTARHQEKMQEMKLHQSGWAAAREFALAFSGGVWSRRFIVLVVFSYLFIFPFWSALVHLPLNFVYPGDGAGILGWIFGIGEGMKSKTFEGFVVMPFQTTIASFIAGFYFGAGTVK